MVEGGKAHKRRLVWLVLHPQYVAWYESPQQPLPLGHMPLQGCQLTKAELER